MEKYRAIPPGKMTSGQLAKKMNTTVRTLQYYDKVGLLPTGELSEGGRRLYSDRDLIHLHQIQSLKYLGFSLNEIRDHLIDLDKPEDVADALTKQAQVVSEKIISLQEVLDALEKLKTEILLMKTVDFKKYADIIILLKQKNENYWLMKHFDENLLDHIRNRFDEESGNKVIATYQKLSQEAVELKAAQVPPDSEQALDLAERWWKMIEEFTGGNLSLLPDLIEFSQAQQDGQPLFVHDNTYIGEIVGNYLEKKGINLFNQQEDK